MIELVVQHTDEEIAEHEADKKRLAVFCRKCNHGWRATVKETIDNPNCPRCGL